MASFIKEKDIVERLLQRLNQKYDELFDPKKSGQESGVDVGIRLPNGNIIGIQVTELDPHQEKGVARAKEKAIANANPDMPYSMWGQNNPTIAIQTLANSIKRKTEIAAKHSFNGFDEIWLLVCSGIPELGAVVSTIMMTPWLLAEDMDSETYQILSKSKYDRCFFFPILGAEQVFYRWEKNSKWEKFIRLEDINEIPRAAYVSGLTKAAKHGDWQEVDRLCDEECRNILSEMRQESE